MNKEALQENGLPVDGEQDSHLYSQSGWWVVPPLPWKSHSVTTALPSSLRAQRENLEVFAVVGERSLAVGSEAPESWPEKLWWQSKRLIL